MSTSIARDGEPLPPYEGNKDLPPMVALSDDVYRARVDVAIALRNNKLSNQEIADQFGVSKTTVMAWFRRARASGKLAEDVTQLLDRDTVFRALEALHEHLDAGNLEATLAVLKGRGHFRNYSNNNTEGGGAITAIQIVYSTPDGSPVPRLTDVATLPGQIVGTPRSDPPKP